MGDMERLRELGRQAKEGNLLIGRKMMAVAKIYEEVTAGDPPLWQRCGYKELAVWLREVGDHEQTQAYRYAETYRKLKTRIPADVIDRLPLNNARDLMLVPDSALTYDVLKAATEMPNRRFREAVEREVPNLNLPTSVYLTYKVDATAEPWIRKAINVVMERQELKSQGAALEWLAVNFLQSIGEAPDVAEKAETERVSVQ